MCCNKSCFAANGNKLCDFFMIYYVVGLTFISRKKVDLKIWTQYSAVRKNHLKKRVNRRKFSSLWHICDFFQKVKWCQERKTMASSVKQMS